MKTKKYFNIKIIIITLNNNKVTKYFIMEFDNKTSNGHLIIVKNIGCSYESQIKEVLTNVLTKANINTDLYINIVFYKKIPCGYAYVWVSNTNAFDFLVGFQDIGYNHVKKLVEVINPDYKNNVEKDEDIFNDPDDFIKKSVNSKNWADEDVNPTHTIKKFIDSEKIYLKSIEYNLSQIQYMKEKDFDWEYEPLNIVLDKGLFNDFGKDNDEDEQRIYNKWVAKFISPDLTFEMLYKHLRRYVTNPLAKGMYGRDKNQKYLLYPHINFANMKDGKRAVYITWDPNSNDGIFALHMNKQLKLDVHNVTHTIYFSHQIRYNK